MKRRLILMRHAKSSWNSSAQTDHERPLNGRGRRSASEVGFALARKGWIPQAVWSSDAVRTRETWNRMAGYFNDALITTQFRSALYGGGLKEIRTLANGFDDAGKTVLLLGHNPGWQEALRALCGVEKSMKTAHAALLTGQGVSWAEALSRQWRFQEMLEPFA